MIADIETKIVEFLKSQWREYGGSTQVNEFDINLDFEDLLNSPAISVATENLEVRVVTPGVIRFKPTISLYTVFRDVGRQDQRRHGVYPVVVASIRLLSGKVLDDLDMDGLTPVSCKEIYHAKLKERGLICFQTQFTTFFDDESIDDQDVVQLLTEGLSYYLGETNDNVNATDEIAY